MADDHLTVTLSGEKFQVHPIDFEEWGNDPLNGGAPRRLRAALATIYRFGFLYAASCPPIKRPYGPAPAEVRAVPRVVSINFKRDGSRNNKADMRATRAFTGLLGVTGTTDSKIKAETDAVLKKAFGEVVFPVPRDKLIDPWEGTHALACWGKFRFKHFHLAHMNTSTFMIMSIPVGLDCSTRVHPCDGTGAPYTAAGDDVVKEIAVRPGGIGAGARGSLEIWWKVRKAVLAKRKAKAEEQKTKLDTEIDEADAELERLSPEEEAKPGPTGGSGNQGSGN